MKSGSLAGGCLCGAVRLEAVGEPLWVAHCHCSSCRKATGAAMATYAGYAADRVTFTGGPVRVYSSSPGVVRRSCGRCGAPVSYESERWPGEIHLHIGVFDAPERLQPKAHVYVDEQMPWLQFADHLPRFDKTSGGGE